MIATQQMQEPLLLSPREVATRLDCSYRRAREMMAAGRLPVVMLGKRRRVPTSALEKWIEAQTRRPEHSAYGVL